MTIIRPQIHHVSSGNAYDMIDNIRKESVQIVALLVKNTAPVQVDKITVLCKRILNDFTIICHQFAKSLLNPRKPLSVIENCQIN